MGKKRTKAKKKSSGPETIRTDVWDLAATNQQKQQMMATVEEYRNFLNPLVLLVNAQWSNLTDLTANDLVNTVEKMIHKTAGNPSPKHSYFKKIITKYPYRRPSCQVFESLVQQANCLL